MTFYFWREIFLVFVFNWSTLCNGIIRKSATYRDQLRKLIIKARWNRRCIRFPRILDTHRNIREKVSNFSPQLISDCMCTHITKSRLISLRLFARRHKSPCNLLFWLFVVRKQNKTRTQKYFFQSTHSHNTIQLVFTTAEKFSALYVSEFSFFSRGFFFFSFNMEGKNPSALFD